MEGDAAQLRMRERHVANAAHPGAHVVFDTGLHYVLDGIAARLPR
jgi:hypothetical protein